MRDDPFPAIVSHLKDLAQSLPGKNRPKASGPKTISWLGRSAPVHRPEARSEHVRLVFTPHETQVRCQISVHISANWIFPAIGAPAEADYALDGLEALIKDAGAIAQWMTPRNKK